MSTFLSILLKALSSLALKLLTEELIEELILWIFKKLSESTKTNIDNELYSIVEGKLKKK